MSTQTSEPAGTGNGHVPKPEGARVYRGRRIEDIVRDVRGDLGPDAIILRQREGLMGGVGGFFQQRFFEVEAASQAPRVDVYDDFAGMSLEQLLGTLEPGKGADARTGADATPADAPPADVVPASLPDATPARRADEAKPQPSFAERLAAAAEKPGPSDDGHGATAPSDDARGTAAASDHARATTRKTRPKPPSRPRRQPAASRRATAPIVEELASRGLGRELGESLVAEAAAHRLAFTPGRDLRAATREALTRRIPVAGPAPTDGAAIAFVGAGGAGKTRCAAALAVAYNAASTLKASCLTLEAAAGAAELTTLLGRRRLPIHAANAAEAGDAAEAPRTALESARGRGLVAVDTPAVSPADERSVLALAASLEPLALDAVLIALPATLGAQAAEQLLGGLRPLGPTGLAITHVDETDQLGVAVDLACRAGVPIAYVHEGLALPDALALADAAALATRLLP